MKIKPSKNMLYSIKANVFPVKLGSEFGRTVHTTVVANNKEDAFEEAKLNFSNFCLNLERNHKNEFSFDNLVVE